MEPTVTIDLKRYNALLKKEETLNKVLKDKAAGVIDVTYSYLSRGVYGLDIIVLSKDEVIVELQKKLEQDDKRIEELNSLVKEMETKANELKEAEQKKKKFW